LTAIFQYSQAALLKNGKFCRRLSAVAADDDAGRAAGYRCNPFARDR
jgi:hypothetical protein